ncbi:MAG TPA: glycosyltransferase [Gemmataceae bacterium]|nr:glycosyltransferase [Gemmataceae bacterium]
MVLTPTRQVKPASCRSTAAAASERRDNRPTICQVLHSLQVGGAEVLAARLARRLQESYRFLFVCLDKLGPLGEALREEGFPVEVLDRRPGLDWRSTIRLARLLRRERVEMLHAHQYTPFFYALTARWLGKRIPVLFTEHGRHFPDYPRRKRIIANRLLLSRRDRVAAVGESVRQAVIANEGIPAERVGVIYNGIDPNSFGKAPQDRDGVRREIGVGTDDLVVIQVARLDYLKDHLTAIRAVERVAVQRPEVRLVLVGEGPEREKIEAEVRQRQLSPHVRFLGLRGDVVRLIPAADLFLLTSISEGIPLTVIEAMAAGLAVVSTRVGGVGEIVVDGQTGLLAPAGDDSTLAEHILSLSADVARRQRMGQVGRQRAHAMFSEEKMHASYCGLYEEVLRGRGSCSPACLRRRLGTASVQIPINDSTGADMLVRTR